jgi:hypothetical protein
MSDDDSSAADALRAGRTSMQIAVDELHRFVARLDQSASIVSVSRTVDATLVRFQLGESTSGASALALLAATRVAYPFSTCSICESAGDGSTQLHVLLHTAREEYRQAREIAYNRRVIRAISLLSRVCFAASILCFSCLFYPVAISPSLVGEQ